MPRPPSRTLKHGKTRMMSPVSFSRWFSQRESSLLDEELRGRIEQMRTALATMPRGVLIGWIHPPRHDLPKDIAGLDQLADLLQVADGVQAYEFILYGVDRLGCPEPQEWLP